MAAQSNPRQSRIFPSLVIGAGAWFVLDAYGPVMVAGQVNPVPATAAGFLALSAVSLTADTFRLTGDLLGWMAARTPTGLKGTAGFVRSLREIGHDLVHKAWGPYWGTFRGREIIADYASNALSLGPAGSSKDVGVVQPTILAIRESKTVIDFKGSSACVLADTLRARGEEVKILNLGDVWGDILGPSEEYNPLNMIADDFERPGGSQDVTDDIHEMNMQLLTEPAGGGDKDGNRYFRDGSRTLMGFAEQMAVLLHGRDATLGDAAQLLNDRRALLQHALWAAGRLEVEEEDKGETGNQGEAP